MTRQENESSNPYLSKNLSVEEHERLATELKNDPELLGELLRHQTIQDETSAAALLFSESDTASQNNLDEEIRSYLLRDPTVETEKFVEFEELFIEDERYLARMTLVESELIEDHLRGNILTTDEKQRFDKYFLVTPERRTKLKFIESIALSYAAAEQQEIELPIAETIAFESTRTASWLESLLSFRRSSNLFVGAAAAGVLLFLFVGVIWWLNARTERQNELIAVAPTNESILNLNRSNGLNPSGNLDQSGNLNQSANTSEVNKSSPTPKTPQPSTIPTPMKSPQTPNAQQPTPAATPTKLQQTNQAQKQVVFALFPGLLRSGSSDAQQKIGNDTESVELRLRLVLNRDYEDYRVVVQDFEDKEIGRREKLKASKNTVTVVLPAAAFQPDDYKVILSGKTKGAYVDLATYTFKILK